MLSENSVVPLVLTGSSGTCVHAVDMMDFLDRRALLRSSSVACGDFTCCRFNHQRLDGTPIPCDKDTVLSILESMWLNRLREVASKRNQWVYFLLRCLETKMFARWPAEPLRATWGWELAAADDASPDVVVDRMENDHLLTEFIPTVIAAANLGDERVLQACVERGYDPQASDRHGNTCLSVACHSESLSAVKYLLSLESTTLEYVNARTPGQFFTTPIHLAVNSVHIINALLRFRASPHSRSWSGKTPLHGAAMEGHVACAQALLSAHAEVGAQDHDGATALHLALSGSCLNAGSLRVARCLLEHLASPNVPNNKGVTVKSLAHSGACCDGAQLLLSEAARSRLCCWPLRAQ